MCPGKDCGHIGSLRLTPWFVNRHAVLFDETHTSVYQEAPVPLAKCKFCKTRRRVLPFEILPGKTYGLPVIEKSCNLYGITSDGLRNTVKKIPGVAPHYSTLHGWIGAIGERALDRVKLCNDRATVGEPSLPPTSALVAETAQKKAPDLIDYWHKINLHIPSWKYKSPFRLERIEACLKLLYVAFLIFKTPYPLTQWEAFLVSVFNVPCWLFLSRTSVTAIQLTESNDNMIVYGQSEQRGPPCKKTH